MKKLIAMLLALVMVLGLVACGGEKAPANEPENGASRAKGSVYCLDLTGTAVANELSTDKYKLYDADGKQCCIGYCYECYGIIVNTALLAEAGYEKTNL